MAILAEVNGVNDTAQRGGPLWGLLAQSFKAVLEQLQPGIRWQPAGRPGLQSGRLICKRWWVLSVTIEKRRLIVTDKFSSW